VVQVYIKLLIACFLSHHALISKPNIFGELAAS
jgi:hypothetical protein